MAIGTAGHFKIPSVLRNMRAGDEIVRPSSQITYGSGVPNWVPANAKIFVDFVGARAWTAANGIVGIDTLLGADPNTDNAYGATSYDAANLNQYGYDSSSTTLGFLGAALTKILAGCTIRFAFTIPVSNQGGIAFYIVSADGNNAVYFESSAANMSLGSYGSNTLATLNSVIHSGAGNETNLVAITATPLRAELAVNGSSVASAVLGETDWPTGGLVAALVDPLGTDPAAIQSIAIYDALPSTAGLSALSTA